MNKRHAKMRHWRCHGRKPSEFRRHPNRRRRKLGFSNWRCRRSKTRIAQAGPHPLLVPIDPACLPSDRSRSSTQHNFDARAGRSLSKKLRNLTISADDLKDPISFDLIFGSLLSAQGSYSDGCTGQRR